MTPWPSWYKPPRRRQCTIQRVMHITADHFGIDPSEIMGVCRKRRYAWPRQLAMLIAREVTGKSYPAIGHHIGGRDHSTIMSGAASAWQRVITSEEWLQHYSAVKAMAVRG